MAGQELGREVVPAPALPTVPEPPAPVVSFAASARRLDPLASKGETALGQMSPNHSEAWAAYDEITEVQTLVSDPAALLAQCRIYAGYVDDSRNDQQLRGDDGKPAEGFDERLVTACETVLARYVDEGGSQAGLLQPQAENFAVTGDCYLVGWSIDANGNAVEEGEGSVGERWVIVARDAISKVSRRWVIQLDEGTTLRLPASALAWRMWRRHPRRPGQARGWVIGALDVCRDLRVFTLAQRSAGRSSIPAPLLVVASEASPKDLTPGGFPAGGQVPPAAQGGVLLTPPPGMPAAPGPGSPPAAPMTWAQTLERLIGDAVMEVLRDAQSGRAVIPAVLSVAEKYVDRFHAVELGRDIDGALSGLVDQCRTRLSEAADAPPEMLKGLGETNRWNGAQIADDEYRRYFKPSAMEIADSWTAALLWPGLRAMGFREDDIRRVRCLVDARGVVAEPDLVSVATDGLKLGAVGWTGWRTAAGIPEEWAPTPEEQNEIREFLRAPRRSGDGQTQAESDEQAEEVDQQVASATIVELPVPLVGAEDGPEDVTARPRFETLRTSRAASGPEEVTGEMLAEQLWTLEEAARARLEEAAEVAFEQAIQRAGSKLRSWARSDQALRGPLARVVDPREVPEMLGPERAAKVVGSRFADTAARQEDLFAAALLGLLASFERVTRSTMTAALRLLGVAVLASGEARPDWARSAMSVAELDAAVRSGGETLRTGMTGWADRSIFDPIEGTPIGEVSTLAVPPLIIRQAMAAAGGAAIDPTAGPNPDAARGLVFGPRIGAYLPDRLGWRWVYGLIEDRRAPWVPHLELNNEVLSGPDDERLDGRSPYGGRAYPGDHLGCRCGWVPVLADPTW